MSQQQTPQTISLSRTKNLWHHSKCRPRLRARKWCLLEFGAIQKETMRPLSLQKRILSHYNQMQNWIWQSQRIILGIIRSVSSSKWNLSAFCTSNSKLLNKNKHPILQQRQVLSTNLLSKHTITLCRVWFSKRVYHSLNSSSLYRTSIVWCKYRALARMSHRWRRVKKTQTALWHWSRFWKRIWMKD